MKITIHVKRPNGDTVDMKIEPTATISIFKYGFWYLYGDSTTSINPTITLNGDRLINDHQTLQDAGIKNGDTVRVERVLDLITIYVKPENSHHVDIEIAPTATIRALKQAFYEKVGTPVNQQEMRFVDLRQEFVGRHLKDASMVQSASMGKKLEDGMTLCNAGIYHEDIIHVGRLLSAQSAQHPSRAGILIAGTAIGAGIAALASTAVSGALGYFAQGTAEQLGMAFGISIPVGALLGFLSTFTALKMRDRNVEMEKGNII